MKEKDVVYVPGWMDRAEHHGFQGPDIWGSEHNLRKMDGIKVLIAHSLGANFAMKNINLFSSVDKIILVNPLIMEKSISYWIRQWLKFMLKEGMFMFDWNRIKMMPYIFKGIPKGARCLKIGMLELMLEASKNKNLIVIRGGKDRFFCCKESYNIMEGCDLNVMEIGDGGHLMGDSIDKKILEIIQK